jgi:hypothetical protein
MSRRAAAIALLVLAVAACTRSVPRTVTVTVGWDASDCPRRVAVGAVSSVADGSTEFGSPAIVAFRAPARACRATIDADVRVGIVDGFAIVVRNLRTGETRSCPYVRIPRASHLRCVATPAVPDVRSGTTTSTAPP